MNNYKGWQLFDNMPVGYKFDRTAGSPLFGYQFATNGKSVINGQHRILVRVSSPQKQISFDIQNDMVTSEIQVKKEAPQVIDEAYARTVNELARAKFKKNLLADIMVDLQICEIEGWCKLEYIKEIKKMINDIKIRDVEIIEC